MATLTMNMSGFEIERSETLADCDEIMYSGWIPELQVQPCAKSRNEIPQDLLTADVETFLKNMYARQ